MTDVERLTAILEALANPLTRQFIEMVAMRPRSTKELQQTFDLPLSEIQTAGRILAKLGFLSERARVTRYDYDARGLSEVADWIARVESIRSTSRSDGS
jgi:YD repeat-containing protein